MNTTSRPMRPMRSLEDRSRRRRQRFTEDKLVKIRTEHNNSGAFKTIFAAAFILVQLAKLYARHKHVDLSASRRSPLTHPKNEG